MSIESRTRRRLSVATSIGVLALSGGFIAACGGTGDASGATPSTGSSPATAHQSAVEGTTQLALYTAMHKAWADHMQYTVATVDAFFHQPKSLNAKLNRLLLNQKQIGQAIVPFYGKAAGDQLTKLLTTHIKQAVPVLKAAKAGNKKALKKALADWYANAKQVADLLTKANPDNWPASATEPMLKMHIDQTTAYAVDLLKGNYTKAIKDYDKAFNHMMDLADTLSAGIIAQFPDKA